MEGRRKKGREEGREEGRKNGYWFQSQRHHTIKGNDVDKDRKIRRNGKITTHLIFTHFEKMEGRKEGREEGRRKEGRKEVRKEESNKEREIKDGRKKQRNKQ